MMISSILQHTPGWVWVLLSILLALGLSQTRERQLSLARITALPVAMITLSLVSLLNAFGTLPQAFAAWAAGFLLTTHFLGEFAAVRDAAWSGATRRVRVPGSWLPLALILGLFLTRYVGNVCLAIRPDLAGDASFAATCALVYGGFSGLFWSRARSLRGAVPRLGGTQMA
jgi:hypothetical protein